MRIHLLSAGTMLAIAMMLNGVALAADGIQLVSNYDNAEAKAAPDSVAAGYAADLTASEADPTPACGGCGACDQCASCNTGCCETSCNNCCQSTCGGCGCIGTWRDNLLLAGGAEAFKSIGDSALQNFNPTPFANANSFGTVLGGNTAFALGNSRIRAQLGSTLGLYDFAGRTALGGNSTSIETQCFLTGGIYKRSNIANGERLAWGVVYDQLWGGNWGYAANNISLSQFRILAGYALGARNEVGLWGTIHVKTDTATFGFPAGVGVRPIQAANQLNLFLRHNWALGAQTMVYAGLVDAGTSARFVTGLQGVMPLSNSWGMYGNFTYLTKQDAQGTFAAAQDQWNIGLGMVYSLGGKIRSRNVSGQQGLPLMPVANNGSFLVTQK